MQEICTFFENLPPLILNILWLIAALILIIAFVSVCAIVLVYGERKVAGFVQRRPGPYEVGPQGILQVVNVGKVGKGDLYPVTGNAMT